MKKNLLIFSIAALLVGACNNEAKDSVEKADSTNTERADADPQTIKTDEATTTFLVNAADGGMTETEAGKMAQQKASNASVKRFADMMVMDHTGANEKVKALAAARNVALPSAPSEEHQKKAASAGEKTGKNFDRAYMDMMVDDHEKTIDLFEQASNNSNDDEVKNFINTTLPTLKMHLDSARAIRKQVN